jgi:hypothetical protein
MPKSIRKIKIIFTCLVLTSVTACKTYIIPVESYKKQMAGIDSTGLKQVKVREPGGTIAYYLANPLKEILCQTKDGREVRLQNSPSIEMRVTYVGEKGKKRKRIFYFDRTALVHGYLYGVQSRLVSAIRSRIPIDSVKLIEVQDGQKKYYYKE